MQVKYSTPTHAFESTPTHIIYSTPTQVIYSTPRRFFIQHANARLLKYAQTGHQWHALAVYIQCGT
jgi:hypothetical protein